MGEFLQASALLMRCECILLTDVIALYDRSATIHQLKHIEVDLTENMRKCDWLVAEAEKTMTVRLEAEGHIFWARLAAMQNSTYDMITAQNNVANREGVLQAQEHLKMRAQDHLESAEKICCSYPDPTAGLMEEVKDVARMLEEGTSASELRMVVRAMAKEFNGTGHWYRCENGHAFTIGECGMAMEEANCPTCNARIGGRNHRSVEGVTHAGDIEARFGDLHLD